MIGSCLRCLLKVAADLLHLETLYLGDAFRQKQFYFLQLATQCCQVAEKLACEFLDIGFDCKH